MTSRRRPPADLAAVKRSRAGCTGAITKALDRFKAIPSATAEDALLINTKEINRILISIEKTETSFLQSLEDAQTFIPEDGEEAFQLEEELACDTFNSAISSTRDLGDQLLCIKAVLNGLANFKCDMDAIKDSILAKPDSNQVSAFQTLENLFSSLRSQWQTANLPRDHPIKAELDSCRIILANLGADVAAAHDKSDSHSTTTSSTSSPCCSIIGKNDLPTIDVPKFNGDILEWRSFWAAFKSTIEDRKELSNTQRLHYLRQAIQDPELQLLLHSPAETSDMYLEVVLELKDRFDKTREIHKLLTRTLADLTSPKQNRAELRRLVDLVKRTISSLKATKHYDLDSFLSSLVYSILPSRLQTSWDQNTKKEKGVPPITQLLVFLKEHAETLPSSTSTTPTERPADSSVKKTTPRKFDRKEQHPRSKGNIHVVTPSTSYRWECSLCRPEKHPLHLCPKWASFNLSQRLGHIQAKGLCSNCLAGGHATTACKSTYRCRECSQLHHTTIHQQQATVTPLNYSTPRSSQVPDALMTTAQVLLIGPRGQELKARALIDSGAGLSLVSKRVAQILELPLEPAKLHLSVAQGELSKPIKNLTTLHISPLQDRARKIQCKPAVTQTVTCDLPSQAIYPVGDLPHLMGLQLADPEYHLPGRIDILLGADMAPKVMVKQLLRDGTDSEPIAQATHFGWVLSGPVRRKGQFSHISANHQTPILQAEPQLDHLLSKFWKTEEPEKEEAPLSVTEEQVENHFNDTVVYLPEESRYRVSLPKKPAMETLGASRPQALSRYLSNERSVIRRDIWKTFQEVVQSYFDLGHAEEVPAAEQPHHPHFYLPMHAVFKDSSSSTKLRVVFDGSAATTSGLSLNQALLVGPTIQPTLSTILIRFRTYIIALNADISKMFREVKLSSEDKDLHRFLWRASPNLPIQDYRMTRVTFGVSASPYLAVRTLQQTAADHGEEYPRATQHILESFYVDDFLGGASTPQEAVELFQQLRRILLKGGFSLCKWRSSSSEVLQNIPTALQEAKLVKDATSPHSSAESKALGLQWNSESDSMSPSISVPISYRPTKRGLISDVSRTYDILGWIAPAVLSMKLVYQQLWKTGHDWDEEVPADLLILHKKWRSELPTLAEKQMPRCYSLPNFKIKHQELHGFSDASKVAYGAVVYCRTTYHDHPPSVSLVTAKTKVAKIGIMWGQTADNSSRQHSSNSEDFL